MTFIPVVTANVSVLNSTTSNLTAGATFTGQPEDVSQYSSLSVSFYVQPPNATGNIFVQFSNVSTNAGWIPISNTVTAVNSTNAAGFTLDTTMTCQYFRVIYVNDSTPQTSLMIQSIYHPQARIAQKTTRFAETPTDYSDMVNTRSMVWGKTLGGGIYEPIAGNGENSLVTAIVDPRTSYGDMQVAEITAVAQIDFSYGINTTSTMNVKYSNATVVASNSLLTITANAAVASSMGYLSPKKFVKYRAGQGTLARFTALFTAGAPGQSVQFAGQGFAHPTSNVIIDACGFGYVGSVFGIHYYNNSSNTFIPQTTWNVDTMLGGTKSGKIIDPTKLNVYECKFQYLGGGNIFFYVYNDLDGRKVLVHMVRNAGTLTGTIFSNPSMRIMWYSNSYAVGNNTPVVVQGGSCGHFIDGKKLYNGPKGGISNYYHNLPTTTGLIYSIFTIRNAQFYNGYVNRSQLHFRNVSISVAGGAQNIGLFSILKNPTVSTISLWTAYNGTGTDGITITNGQSTAFSNVATGITVTGGNTIFSLALGSTPSNAYADLTDYDVVAYPGDIVAFVVSVPSGGATGDYGASVTWSEDL